MAGATRLPLVLLGTLLVCAVSTIAFADFTYPTVRRDETVVEDKFGTQVF